MHFIIYYLLFISMNGMFHEFCNKSITAYRYSR